MKKKVRKTEDQIVDQLRVLTNRKRGLTDTAQELGFTIQFISDVVYGRRGVSENLARKMGYRRIVEFEEVA
jgi:hypothetical protein